MSLRREGIPATCQPVAGTVWSPTTKPAVLWAAPCAAFLFNLCYNVSVIRKRGSQYVILSESTHIKNGRKVHKVLGRYKTRKEAQNHLRQIEYFKHLKSDG